MIDDDDDVHRFIRLITINLFPEYVLFIDIPTMVCKFEIIPYHPDRWCEAIRPPLASEPGPVGEHNGAT